MPRFVRLRFSPALLALALATLVLLAAAPLSAQTLFLFVRESSGGAGLPVPLPASEGLQSSLFDRGFIVIGVRTDPLGAAELAEAARSAGAEAALQLLVEYTEPARGGDPSRISAAARFSLLDAASGHPLLKGTEEASNLSRKKPLSRADLGREVGARVAARIVAAFAAGKTAR